MKKIIATITVMMFLMHSLLYPVAVPAGLVSLGNTCYMNSTLQCLYQIEPLTNFLLTHESVYKPGTIALEYSNFIKKIPQKLVAKTDVRQLCNPIFVKFFEGRINEQEDTSDFLGKLLAYLMDDDVKEELKSEEFIEHTSSKKSPVMDFFLPLIFTKEHITNTPNLPNPKCQPSSKTELVTMLNIPIQKIETSRVYNDQADAKKYMIEYKTLNECLAEVYQKPENVTGDEGLSCEDGSKTDFTKQTKIESSPQFLIIALKRFFNIQTIAKGFQSIKDSHAVSFPLYDLDLTPYMTDDSKQIETKYDLISFVQHGGSLGGGHYTSWVRSNGEWYFCNDSSIKKSDNEKDIENISRAGLDNGFTPYILIYKRKDVPGLSLKQTKETFGQLETQIQALANRAEQIEKTGT